MIIQFKLSFLPAYKVDLFTHSDKQSLPRYEVFLNVNIEYYQEHNTYRQIHISIHKPSYFRTNFILPL